MSDLPVRESSSMSSRRMAWRLPSPSTSSMLVADSPAKHAVQHAAIGEHDDVRLVVAFDIAAGVENVDEQLLLAVNAHAGEIGSDGRPFALVAVADGASSW